MDPANLGSVAALYICGTENQQLLTWTRQLHQATPGPKEWRQFKRSRRSVLSTPDWATYDAEVVDFFKRRLPISGSPPKPKPKARRASIR